MKLLFNLWNRNNIEQTISMKKLDKLAAMIGKDAAAITPDEVSAVNAELAEAGVKGIEIAVNGSAKKAVDELAAANTKITSLEAELTKWKPKSEANATHTTEKGADKETPETKSNAGEAFLNTVLSHLGEK